MIGRCFAAPFARVTIPLRSPNVCALRKHWNLRTEPLRFDLVVTDYKLPGLSGLDFYRAVDDEERAFAVVLLTGAGTERLAVEALRAGIDDYLIKDTHHGYVELLPTVLREVVRWREDRVARKRAEEELHKAHEELERRVRARTAELQRTNTVLRTEITARKKVEAVLQRCLAVSLRRKNGTSSFSQRAA